MIKGYLNIFGDDCSVRVKVSHARKVEGRNGKEYDESITLYLPAGTNLPLLSSGDYVHVKGDFYFTRTKQGAGDIVMKVDGTATVTKAPPRDSAERPANPAPKRTLRAAPF